MLDQSHRQVGVRQRNRGLSKFVPQTVSRDEAGCAGRESEV